MPSAMSPRLETERLILKAPEADDLVFWMKFLTTERSQYMGGGPEVGLGEIWRQVAVFFAHWQIHGFGQYVIYSKDSPIPIGAAGINYPFDWPEKELVYALWDPASEGNGFAREAVLAIIPHLYDDLNWDPLVSYIHQDNAPSFAFAERLGAKPDPDADTPVEIARVLRYPATSTAIQEAAT